MVNRPNKSFITGGKYIALATALPGYVLAGFFLGAFLERWLHWPILRGLGIILGASTGLYQLIRHVLLDEKRAQKAEDPPK